MNINYSVDKLHEKNYAYLIGLFFLVTWVLGWNLSTKVHYEQARNKQEIKIKK